MAYRVYWKRPQARRGTLHRAAAWADARKAAKEIGLEIVSPMFVFSARHGKDTWPLDRRVAYAPTPRCLYVRRRARQQAETDAWHAQYEAEQREQDRKHRKVEYFRLTPFSNGTEYDMYTTRNCDRCARLDGWDGYVYPAPCDLVDTLMIGEFYDNDKTQIGNGTAWRLGMDVPGDGSVWRCREFVSKEGGQ